MIEQEPPKRGVGRPGTTPEKMMVRFPAGAFARIDAVAGRGHRAEFIRDAVDQELQRREREAARLTPIV